MTSQELKEKLQGTPLFKRSGLPYSDEDIAKIVRANDDIAYFDNAKRDKRFRVTSEQVEYRLALCEIIEQLTNRSMRVRVQ